ncbi:folate-binding protein YgfZ [Rhizobiales bacterium]|uniref:CAF17-like 4Fe-4S cluster assembly/insertion protein YgfZ n=1 Tax=Hongsoonwoonella zoysiae TaxID=2821844 RepID=UPI00156040E5|nr:folate-binding protein YgfZ [Hongsoonwoonella zoysiae]NRG19731.1 folate-binding protein YgfZ [Hongsoonwoonella zoysiae]
MQTAQIAELTSRGVVHVTGPEAHGFLHNLVTCDMNDVEKDGAAYGALLTPQGKVLFDFIMVNIDDGYLADVRRDAAGELAKRLTFYKLRAKVEVKDVSDDLAVLAAWGTDETPEMPATVVRDPRLAALGFRAIGARIGLGADLASPGLETSDEDAYHAHRISLGVPEGGIDFPFADAFPHDADMDDLDGVAFDKGCYVGQEVVSRMKHRGTARKRVIIVHGDGDLPEPGTGIEAGGKPAGTLGSSSGAAGLALVRLDRIKDALDAGESITAAGVTLRPAIPAWASFDWPKAQAD